MKYEDAYAEFCKYEAAAAACYASGQTDKAIVYEEQAIAALEKAEHAKELQEIKSFTEGG